MYHIQHAGPKGFGLFATRAIQRGTRILAERPTFTIRSDHDLLPAFKTIASGNKAYISNLSASSAKKPPVLDWSEAVWHVVRGVLTQPRGLFPLEEYKTLLAAFRNNCFNIGDDTRAIFHDISRLNHSCVPNAQGNFNSALGSFTIHATQEIKHDQEITISYLAEHGAMRHSREAQLHQGYGFKCGCPACDSSTARGQESEKRRKDLREKLVEFAKNAEGLSVGDGKAELEMVMSLIRMFEEEGLWGRELATM